MTRWKEVGPPRRRKSNKKAIIAAIVLLLLGLFFLSRTRQIASPRQQPIFVHH